MHLNKLCGDDGEREGAIVRIGASAALSKVTSLTLKRLAEAVGFGVGKTTFERLRHSVD